MQAKELLDHLEGVLSNEPVEVVAGAAIIEVKPQGVSKGNIVERILTDLSRRGPPDFVLCIGDDRSDEDMFTAMEHVTFSPHLPAEVCQDFFNPIASPTHRTSMSKDPVAAPAGKGARGAGRHALPDSDPGRRALETCLMPGATKSRTPTCPWVCAEASGLNVCIF